MLSHEISRRGTRCYFALTPSPRSDRKNVYHRKETRVTSGKVTEIAWPMLSPPARAAVVASPGAVAAPVTLKLNSGQGRELRAVQEHQRLPSASMPAWLSALTPLPKESRRRSTIFQDAFTRRPPGRGSRKGNEGKEGERGEDEEGKG